MISMNGKDWNRHVDVRIFVVNMVENSIGDEHISRDQT